MKNIEIRICSEPANSSLILMHHISDLLKDFNVICHDDESDLQWIEHLDDNIDKLRQSKHEINIYRYQIGRNKTILGPLGVKK